jgi:hypothetical protein
MPLGDLLNQSWSFPFHAQSSIGNSATGILNGESTFALTSPQFFIVLIAGLILALAFQLVLSSLSLATGISMMGGRTQRTDDDISHKETFGHTIRKMGSAAGAWTVITVSIALFAACYLSVRLSQTASPFVGTVLALVIWAAYFSFLLWVGSTRLGSFLSTVISTAMTGLQYIFGAAGSLFAGRAASKEIVSTAEAAAAAVRKELIGSADPEALRDSFMRYLDKLNKPETNLAPLRNELKSLLADPNFKNLVGHSRFEGETRKTFIEMAKSKAHLSKKDANRLADELENVWNEASQTNKDPFTELLEFLKTSHAHELAGMSTNRKLDELIHAVKENAPKTSSGFTPLVGAIAAATLKDVLLSRKDLSHSVLDNTLSKFTALQKFLSGGPDVASPDAPAPAPKNEHTSLHIIRQDVENWLVLTPRWILKGPNLSNEFRELIYDKSANPLEVRRQLSELDRKFFQSQLQIRPDLYAFDVDEIAVQLEDIRMSVMKDLLANSPDAIESLTRVPEEQGQPIAEQVAVVKEKATTAVQTGAEDIKARLGQVKIDVEQFLRSLNIEELNPESLKRDLSKIASNPSEGVVALRERLSHLDRNTIAKILIQRSDLKEEDIQRHVDKFFGILDEVTNAPRRIALRTQRSAKDMQTHVEDYLRNTNKEELNPDGIKRDLQLIFQSPQLGFSHLGERFSKFDRSTWVALLLQRKDMTEEEANRIVDRVVAVREQLTMPFAWVQTKMSELFERIFNGMRTYLNSTNRPELSYEGIRDDLFSLLHDPSLGFDALRERLSHFDRNTVKSLIAAREDFTEEEAERLVHKVESAKESMMRRAEWLQKETERRLSELKQKSMLQLEEGRKAAATAAWWVFATALVSALVSGLAGALAAQGM